MICNHQNCFFQNISVNVVQKVNILNLVNLIKRENSRFLVNNSLDNLEQIFRILVLCKFVSQLLAQINKNLVSSVFLPAVDVQDFNVWSVNVRVVLEFLEN